MLSALDEARALYRHAIDNPGWSPVSAVHTTGLSPSGVQAAIHTLLSVGLLEDCPESLSGTRAVATGTALSRLVDAGRATAEMHHRRLDFLSSAVPFVAQEAMASAQTNRVPVETEIVTGADRIAIALDHCTAGATDEVVSLEPERNPALAEWERIGRRYRGTAERGVITRSVHRTGETEQRSRRLAELIGAGIDVRTAPVVPFPLLVVDRRLAVVSDPTSRNDESALIIKCTTVAHVLHQVFEQYWQVAVPPVRSGTDGPLDTIYRRTILRLMAGGLKDESIAREMGVSVRTLRRQIADLMEEVGLRTRFQLGAHAQATSWIGHTPERPTHVA
ncbi:hypothetical protein [Micromonospora sp. ALFpr18c]|uniref:helix-turn-helix transcriptional regulator n=1 Tax=Micromonospora sp. ALFpr18c TaxID=1458665 RepID=UPI001788C7B7|nr:hypothetical protein [Micromonospora sp. ALFpr18c]